MIVFAIIFFIFHWTNKIFNNIEKSYISDAENTYSRLEKVTQIAQDMKSSENRQNIMTEGLLSYIQKSCGEINIAEKLINLRPVSSNDRLEHISMRLENLYYDEFIKLVSKIESFDNLFIKSVSFTKRYDNPQMIDVSIEVVKS